MWLWHWNEHGCLPLHIILLPSDLATETSIRQPTLIGAHLHKLLLLQAQLMRLQVARMYVLLKKKVLQFIKIIQGSYACAYSKTNAN